MATVRPTPIAFKSFNNRYNSTFPLFERELQIYCKVELAAEYVSIDNACIDSSDREVVFSHFPSWLRNLTVVAAKRDVAENCMHQITHIDTVKKGCCCA